MTIVIILAIIGAILLYWHIPFSPMHHKFRKEMQRRGENIEKNDALCLRKEIDTLPEPLKKYCDFICLENQSKPKKMHTVFKKTKFVFDESTGKIINMDYDLWIFLDKPYRQAFCSSSIYGIPFEGIDYQVEGKEDGGMKGYLAKCIRIFDTKIPEIQRTMLITILAEAAVLNPSVLLSEYVKYEQISDTRVKAVITYHGISGEGIFTFDSETEALIFESDQRQVPEEINGKIVNVGWRCEGTDFVEKDGVKVPARARAVKIYPDREVVYFDASDITTTFD